MLEDEITGRDLIYPARRLPEHGLEAWSLVKQQGWEGMVAKDPTAPYQAGSTRAHDVTWLAPRLLGKVGYSELMEDRLREPVLRELRIGR